MDWYTTDVSTALDKLNTDKTNGLTFAEAGARLNRHGPNELVDMGGRAPLRILWQQLAAPLALVLIAAVVVAALLGQARDAIAILATLSLYILPGFVQEYRAGQSIVALKKLAVPQVMVVREGNLVELSARELVPGDIVLLEMGNLVPADLRLLEAAGLQIQEAALTGESEPVSKLVDALDGSPEPARPPSPRPDPAKSAGESRQRRGGRAASPSGQHLPRTAGAGDAGLPLADRRNMAYLGTLVTAGRGRGLVVATGMATELGRIAGLVQQAGAEKTPLQRRLDGLGKLLVLGGAGIAALIFALGLLRGDELRHLLLTTVSLAVAIVPEGLPAVAALTLALGARRMRKRGALIRRLPSVATLGALTVICSDKTGTLTENRMTVIALDVAEHRLDLTEQVRRGGSINLTFSPLPPGRVPARVEAEGGEGKAEATSAISLSAIGGALCNDASLLPLHEGEFTTLGDPTEGALLAAAAHLGYWKDSLDTSFPRVAELPFDAERKRMSTVHTLARHDPELLVGLPVGDAPFIAFTKGAVDGLLGLSSRLWVQGEFKDMDAAWRERVLRANDEMAAQGMRVLGVAFRLLDELPAPVDGRLETDLTLVGLFGMIDPPRPEVRAAVAACKAAGIRPVMITGDHHLTALEIARQLGIVESNVSPGPPWAGAGRRSSQSQETLDSRLAITGAELDGLSFDELREIVDDTSVYARISPEHRLEIVQALQSRGQVVSMTGDGADDAPALRRADVGVAMGLAGTEVSKEASDLVILDDNFATIVGAVGEGRTISDNLRKVVRFFVTGALGKALVLLPAPLIGEAIPLLPLQLLWLNLLVDLPLGLGLGAEAPEQEAMKRPPYSSKEGAFTRGGLIQGTWVGGLIGALALALGTYYFFGGHPAWQTVVFTFLACAQVFQALALRSSKESLFKLGILSNPLLAVMALLVVALQLAVLYIPALSATFDVVPLSAMDLAIAAGAGALIFVAMELEKVFKNK